MWPELNSNIFLPTRKIKLRIKKRPKGSYLKKLRKAKMAKMSRKRNRAK